MYCSGTPGPSELASLEHCACNQMSEASTLVEEDLERQILELQKAAVAKKREGDIESAKHLLLQSKQLRVQLDNAAASRTNTSANTSSASVPLHGEQNKENEKDTEDVEDHQGDKEEDDLPVEEDLLKELTVNTPEQSKDQSSLTGTPGFSLEEMTDIEMMTEFATGGLPTPSLQDYRKKIDECKQSAITFKHKGKTQDALERLRLMKQLQAVHSALGTILGEDNPSSVHAPRLDEETTEEKELLKELLGERGDAEPPDFESNSRLDPEDLLQMDVDEIKDAIELGMKLPSVESITVQADQQKALALRLKQSGDLDGAKAALLKSKTWTQKASTIQHLMQQAKEEAQESVLSKISTSHEIQEVDLERLLLADESAKLAKKQSDSEPLLTTTKVKSSEELRQEAIRLRDEKKTAEATAALKLYKEALAREAGENERRQQDEIVARLQNEILVAKVQQNRFFFYQQLCDMDSGRQQIQAWCQYAEICRKMAQRIKTLGSKSVTITTETDRKETLRLLPEDLTDTIHAATDPTEQRIEVSILQLDISELTTNKVYQDRIRQGTAQSIRYDVHVSIQVPLAESEIDHPINLVFRSSPTPVNSDSGEPNRIKFDGRQYVTLVRGESKFAKLILRRLERRKITILVDCHFFETSSHRNKRSAWFGGKMTLEHDESKEPLNLGKVVLETRTLLDHGCIVGTFPLLGTGKRHVGGTVDLCIRTGVSFTINRLPDGVSTMPTTSTRTSRLQSLPEYAGALKFSLAKEN